jgi:hypothetical protein
LALEKTGFSRECSNKTINKYIGKGLRREELGGVESKRGGVRLVSG